MNATAAVLYEVKKPVVVEDVEVLEPGAHEVLVKWTANGVCHSDLHVITGDYPHPLPVVLGHDAAGVFNRAKVPPGASVAVFGCGGGGLNTIQAARLVGAGKIIAVDVMPQKLAWAEEFGATHVVNAATEDPVARVQSISGTGGVDFAFELVGTQATIEQAVLATHRRGPARLVRGCPAGPQGSPRPAPL